jgi:steroid delta-isomerase-like uncharacterized protein
MQAEKSNELAASELRLLHTFYQAFSPDHPDLIHEAVTTDWEDIPLAPGQGPGAAGLVPIIRGFVAAFPDLRVQVEDIVGGRGRVAVRARITGTQRGEFFGVPATNRPISIAIHDFHELSNGRIRRTWHLEDWFSMLRQLGAWPTTRSIHPERA